MSWYSLRRSVCTIGNVQISWLSDHPKWLAPALVQNQMHPHLMSEKAARSVFKLKILDYKKRKPASPDPWFWTAGCPPVQAPQGTALRRAIMFWWGCEVKHLSLTHSFTHANSIIIIIIIKLTGDYVILHLQMHLFLRLLFLFEAGSYSNL